MKEIKTTLFVLGLLALMSTNVWAETRVIKGKGVAFSPAVTFAQSGDVIAFKNMAAHFVQSITIPDGAEKMISDMGADYNYTLDKEGVYLYKCPPHWGARMGGIIVVGDAAGLVATLDSYMASTTDKIAKGFMKKIKKKIKKGKIKLP